MAVSALLTPAAAMAAPDSSTSPEHEVTVTEFAMKIDCSTFSESDRERAVKEGLDLCGSLSGNEGVSTRGQNTSNCGTAAVYVDKRGGNGVRISWGLHSTMGNMIFRTLYVNYGPGVSGSFPDISAMATPDYSNRLNLTGTGGKKMGATLSGVVTIFGWTFGCSVYAYETPKTV